MKKNPAAEDERSASPAERAAQAAESKAPVPQAAVRVSDEDLAAALASFGWQVSAPETPEPAPASETLSPEPAAELLPEEPAAQEPVPEEREAEEEHTSIFQTVTPAEAEEALAARQEAEKAAHLEETGADELHMDVRELFSGMDREVLNEVFSPEERKELEREETHIFSKEDIDNLAEQEQAAAQKRRERRQATQVLRTPRKPKPAAAEKPARKQEEAAPEYTSRDFRPIRRRRSYRTGLRGGLMYFGFVVCVSVILASLAWLAADDVLSLNKDYREEQIYVGEEKDIDQVSAELYSKGLIKYRRLFRFIAKLMNAESKIDPGVYTISTKLDYNAMIHAMHQDTDTLVERPTVMVTIPEGKNLRQTFQILAEHGVCPYETLLECAANYEFKYSFLSDLPYGDENRLEGYLFPDTYQFFAPSDPEDAIDKFLSNFDDKMNADTRQKVADSGYSLHQILTVASLIELEAGNDAERATIASVIFNRLSSSYYPYLQIDATIQYALGEHKESLTNADLEIDSPYNTYKYTGLPPGPIANPGMASIRAALSPESTGYYFYALNTKGTHNFFATMSQFESFVNSSEFGG